MDYLDPQAFHRLSGRAYFTPAGDAGQIDLGNIQMHSLTFGVKRRLHLNSVRGIVAPDRVKTYYTEPKFTIDGDEFVTPLLPLIFLGSAKDQFTQNSATVQTKAFDVVVAGRAYDLGAFDVTNVSVTDPGGTAGVDFIV